MMFEASTTPRIFGLPPGADFPAELLRGLRHLSEGQPPEALARVQLIVNTRRMARRIRDLFDQGSPLLLPRIQLVTDLGELTDLAEIPPPVPALRRRLELVQLVSTLLDQQPELAARASLFDLADSLAELMDEMQGEGVLPEQIMTLDISDQSGHWERAKQFLTIVQHYFSDSDARPDAEARQRRVILRQIERWQKQPPQTPVILAGSTGSRGSTHLLMQAVARLPQGAVVLPGFDFDMPERVWAALGDGLLSEDHPQYRFRKLMDDLEIAVSVIKPWFAASAPNPQRNRILSLALRPAPVTDQWLEEGPGLHGFDSAFANVTLIEAPTARQEALSIAMRLREAAEIGQTAALITPDRMLTRQVTAALDRWNILPDDSAGLPLHLSATGRFLRHVSALFEGELTAEALMTLLKHPLTHSGEGRGQHLLLTRELELSLRRYGPPFPTVTTLTDWATRRKDQSATSWIRWVCDCFTDYQNSDPQPLADRVERHLILADRIAQGSVGEGSGNLWREAAGKNAQAVCEELRREAPYGGLIDASDYHDLFGAVLSRAEVRNQEAPHSLIRIWGTLEARVQGADLLILAGLNEGSWPESPKPDPWLNRKMRHDAGLLLPERRIGLSAHDFQQAVAAREVWLTRSIRSDEAETVPSRWLNRLVNLLRGLPDQGGRDAQEAMVRRGQLWLDRARAFEAPLPVPPAPRAAPRPPQEARPRRLSVTEIQHLIRDPYTIYARHILRLRPLDPLMQAPDFMLRGTVIHKVFEDFVKSVRDDTINLDREALLSSARATLTELVPWPETRLMWLARIARVADWFVSSEEARLLRAQPVAFEVKGQASLPDLGFTLSGTADRIDRDMAGNLHIFDYKTGAIPTHEQQRQFDKQLLLETAIAELAGFGDLGPHPVARAAHIGLGSNPQERDAPLDEEPVSKVWADFHRLISAYLGPDQHFLARRALHSKNNITDYDQLSRFGEWDTTQSAPSEDLS